MKDFIFNIKSNLKTYNYIWKYKLLWCLPLILILVLSDWISKAIVVTNMKIEGTNTSFIPGFIRFEYTINPGAAYGMNADNLGLAVSIASIVTVFLIGIFIFIRNKYWLIPISLMVSGSIANLLGRAWAPETNDKISKEQIKGGVVDFIKFEFNFLRSNEYIFNLADAWVCIAVAIIAVIFIIYIALIIKGSIMKNKNESKFDFYNEIINKKTLLFESYYCSLSTKQEDKITYFEYLKKNKEISKEWKEYKKKE